MTEIVLYGSVGASWWDEEYFTAADVREQLAQASGPITVRINSGGGIATEGQAIYTALVDYPGEVHVVVDGVAASAASLIAMAGDTITMRLGAWMLVHDPAVAVTIGRGTEADHLIAARQLRVLGDAYADIYARRAGIGRDEARRIMREETVMDGETAVLMGFATAYDTGTAAAAAARFDYRIYAHAPADAREASETLGAPGATAALAVLAGAPAFTQQKEVLTMTDTTVDTTAAEVTAVEEATTEAQAETETTVEAVAHQPAVTMDVARVMGAARAAKLSADETAEILAANVDTEAALKRVVAKWAGKGDVDVPMMGREPAKILRDERDTRRVGMTSALHAQLSRTAPEHQSARAYMGMSLAEMAAECAGYRGPLRTAADRQAVFEMSGVHSTSDFPKIFENALNKTLLGRYAETLPVYRQIAREVSFNDFRAHPMYRAGDFPELKEIGEGGEIKYGTFSEGKESVAIKSYAVAVSIPRQMLINDDMGAISQIIADQGAAVARFEDKTFFAMMISGTSSNGPTLATTSRQVFNTTDKSLASSAAAINVTSVGLGRAAMRKRTGLDGASLDVVPTILLCGPDKEIEALQLLAPITAGTVAAVNPLSGSLTPVVTARITDNSWYLFASPSAVPCFVYGFLSGQSGPRMRTEEPFGLQGVRMSLEHDFGCGAIDFRGGYRNAGG